MIRTTPTGRVRYGEPNLQSIPVRTSEGDALKKAVHAWAFGEPKAKKPKFRKIGVAEDGSTVIEPYCWDCRVDLLSGTAWCGCGKPAPKAGHNAQNEHQTRPILTDNDLQTGSVKPCRSE